MPRSTKLARPGTWPEKVLFPLLPIDLTFNVVCFNDLNKGRKVASEATNIPIPGSTIDHIAISTALEKKWSVDLISGIYAMRTSEHMLPMAPKANSILADTFAA